MVGAAARRGMKGRSRAPEVTGFRSMSHAALPQSEPSAVPLVASDRVPPGPLTHPMQGRIRRDAAKLL